MNLIVFVTLFAFYNNSLESSLFIITLFLRENLYLFLILFEVAEVNEAADELSRLLSLSTAYERTIEGGLSAQDMRQMAIWMDARDRPISFPLAHCRLTRWKVTVQLGLMALTSFFALSKQYMF
jgi:hypothetical protein